MRAIWKFVIDPKEQTIEIPRDAEILSVGCQGTDFCLWAIVETNAFNELRQIKILGTGHEIKHFGIMKETFLGTVEYPGNLWFHLFDLGVM